MKVKFGKKSKRVIDPIFSVSVRSDNITIHRNRITRHYWDITSTSRARLGRFSRMIEHFEREWISDYNEYNIWRV